MRYIFILLLLIPVGFLFCQSPVKGTNTIAIKATSFDQAVAGLLAKGFFIDEIDNEHKVVTTKDQWISSASVLLSIQLYEKDSIIYVKGKFSDATGQHRNDAMYKRAEPVVYRGLKIGEYRACFKAMDDFARSLGKPVEYLTQ